MAQIEGGTSLVRSVRELRRRTAYGLGPRLMSHLRKRWLLLANPHVNIVFEGPVYLGPGFRLHAPQGGTLILGPSCEFRNGFRAELGPHAVLRFREGCICTYDIVIQCSGTIDLGPRATLGQNALIADGKHHFRDPSQPPIHQGFVLRPIRIEQDATVHSKCTIIAGLGRHAIVGAHSLVLKDIPAYSLAVGAPARVVDSFAPAAP